MTTARIRHILVPIDGSEPSRHAVRQAVAFARWSGARITALHVSVPVYASVPEFMLVPAGGSEDAGDGLQQWARRAFCDERPMRDMPFEFECREGNVVTQILNAVDRLAIDLIVMGTHGAGGFEHFVLGSTTEKVLRRASCPVLTVPPREIDVSRLPFQRVLCATDFSNCSIAAVEQALTIAEQSNAHVTLAHVVEWPWVEPPPPAFDSMPAEQAVALAAYRRDVESRAATHLKALVPVGLEDQCSIRVSHGKAYVEILRIAFEEHADAIVLGVHGRNAIEMTLFGSTTNQVVRRAVCPVLTLRH